MVLTKLFKYELLNNLYHSLLLIVQQNAKQQVKICLYVLSTSVDQILK